MLTKIDIGDNCKITYLTTAKLLRKYHFEYTTFHGIKHPRTYEIYLSNVDGKDYFKVSDDINAPQYFDTYDEATNYVFEECGKLRNNIIIEEEQIRTYIETNNKRKKGVKVS